MYKNNRIASSTRIVKIVGFRQKWKCNYCKEMLKSTFQIDHKIALKDINNQPYKIDYSKNKYTLIDFWFHACKPCLITFPDLKNVHKEFNSKGFEIIGISVDATKNISKWKNAVKKHELPWINILDENGWPVLLLSEQSIHTVNIKKNSMVSLFCQLPRSVNNQAAAALSRVTLMGSIVDTSTEELSALKLAFTLAHPYAEQIVDSPKFSFCKIKPSKI
jgi:thiol-disulfide isomerase/thioredoxin